jgi:hypothetical protein
MKHFCLVAGLLCAIVAIYAFTARSLSDEQPAARNWCRVLGVADGELADAERAIRAGDLDTALRKIHWVRTYTHRVRDEINRRAVMVP